MPYHVYTSHSHDNHGYHYVHVTCNIRNLSKRMWLRDMSRPLWANRSSTPN